LEEDYTGARRFALERRPGASDALLGRATSTAPCRSVPRWSRSTPTTPPPAIGWVNLFDSKKQPAKAVAEFERVLSRPENKELVNKLSR
jgi:hypothetical protein